MPPKKSVAQMHLMNTSSTAGIPVCIVKNPMEPNIAIEIVSLIIAAIFNILPPLFNYNKVMVDLNIIFEICIVIEIL